MDLSGSSPVPFTSMTDEVYRRLRAWIIGGDLSPGTKLSIRSLADMLGVSPTPIREAIKRLQADGLVVASRRELSVTQIDRVQVRQVFEVRMRLEHLANEWAIVHVSPQALTELGELADAMEEPGIDPAIWRELNRDYHRTFYALSDNQYLLELIESAWDRTAPYLAIYTASVSDFEEANRQHRGILDDIRAGELPALQESLKRHIEYTQVTLLEAMESENVSRLTCPSEVNRRAVASRQEWRSACMRN